MIDFSKIGAIQAALNRAMGMQGMANVVVQVQSALEKQISPILNARALMEKALPKTAIDLVALGALSKNNTLPGTAIELIISLSEQSERMAGLSKAISGRFAAIDSVTKAFDGPKIMAMALQKSTAMSQLASWQTTVNILTDSLTRQYVRNKAWDSLAYLEQFTIKVSEISDEVVEHETAARDLIDRIVEFFYRELEYLKASPKYASAKILNLMAVISFFWQFPIVQDYFLRKPEAVTKEDFQRIVAPLQTVQKEILMSAQSTTLLNRRITTRACNVRLRNKPSSICITTLPVNIVVDVVQIHHEWAYVSYINPHHGFIECGWVMKKYLREY